MRMEQATFMFICSSVVPYMQRVDMRMRHAIPLETRVAIAISRLATSHGMQMIVDFYEVGLSTSQKIVLEFFGAVKKFFEKQIYQMAIEFNDGPHCSSCTRFHT